MVLLAEIFQEKELIFPEIAALVIGTWVFNKPPWGSDFFHYWISPSLAALTGFCLVKFSPIHPILNISIALILVYLQLKLLKSKVLPSISASILPILSHAESWYYPISVFVMTFILFIIKVIFFNVSIDDLVEEEKNEHELEDTFHNIKIFFLIILFTTVAYFSNYLFLIAPPLIVTFIELSKSNSKVFLKTGRIILFISLSSFLGFFWLVFVQSFGIIPIWVLAPISFSIVLYLQTLFKIKFPPIAAINLIPLIITPSKQITYPFEATIGAFLLLSVNFFIIKKYDIKSYFRSFYN
jgi:uncharacterized membrane protein (DUF485 family)